MPSELINSLAIPGLPEWSGLVVALLLLLAAIAFLLMPFSVFGVKGRLESLEAQLDEIQDEVKLVAQSSRDLDRDLQGCMDAARSYVEQAALPAAGGSSR